MITLLETGYSEIKDEGWIAVCHDNSIIYPKSSLSHLNTTARQTIFGCGRWSRVEDNLYKTATQRDGRHKGNWCKECKFCGHQETRFLGGHAVVVRLENEVT